MKPLHFAFALASLGSVASAQTILKETDIVARARMHDGVVQDLQIPDARAPFELSVVIDGREEVLSLYPHSLRSPEYQLLVQGADGELRPGPVTVESTFRGEVLGFPGSSVAASVRDGQIEAVFSLSDDRPELGIEPVRRFEKSAARTAHLVYDMQDAIGGDETCGTDTLLVEQHPTTGAVDPQAVTFDLKLCQIACDADVEFYNWAGGTVEDAEAEIESILNGVDKTYADQVEIVYEITTIIVRTAEPDPYSTSSAGGLLNQFRNHWNSQQGGIQRDIAHLFTGKDLNGSTIGIANLGVICSNFNGYGLSQSNFSGVLAERRALTAHELGHNWSAQHCDGQSDCAIMCSGLGGCTGGLKTFGDFPSAQILNEKNTSGCLSVPTFDPPNPLDQDPAVVAAFQGAEVEITGTDLRFVTELRLDGAILDESQWDSVNDTKLRIFSTPYPTVGDMPLTITTLGGSAEFIMQTSAVSGLILSSLPVLPTTLDFTLEWLGPPNDIYLLTWGTGFGTVPAFGFDILTPSTLLIVDALSDAGTGALYAPNPGLPSFTQLTFQVLYFDENNFAFTGATPVASTLFF